MTQSTPAVCSTDTTDSEHSLSPSEARSLVEQGAVLIDVRRAQFRAGQPRLEKAVWLPLTDIEAHFAAGKGVEQGVHGKQQCIVLFCATGAGSVDSARQLQTLGYGQTRYIRGGIQAWLADGLPVIAAEA
jgi:rhodanese-related sulfurtransferase